jgi:hypothetical protein
MSEQNVEHIIHNIEFDRNGERENQKRKRKRRQNENEKSKLSRGVKRRMDTNTYSYRVRYLASRVCVVRKSPRVRERRREGEKETKREAKTKSDYA